jgi:hypothetical protein
MLDRTDLEPVFFAPFISSLMRVEPQWIDYNGHLNTTTCCSIGPSMKFTS